MNDPDNVTVQVRSNGEIGYELSDGGFWFGFYRSQPKIDGNCQRGWTSTSFPFQNASSGERILEMCLRRIKNLAKYYELCPCKVNVCGVSDQGDTSNETSSDGPNAAEKKVDATIEEDIPVFILLCLAVILLESLLIIYSVKKLQRANRVHRMKS